MGISGSKTKTRAETSQSNSETTSGTTMPVTPLWLQDAAANYVGRIADFGDMDPNRFVAAAAPLQRMAWNNVGNLSDWQGQARSAAELARSAGTAPAHLAAAAPAVKSAAGAASSYAAPAIKATAAPKAVGAGQVDLGPAAQARAHGWSAPELGDAALVTGKGYAAPALGDAEGYAAARTGAPIGAVSQGYDAQGAGNVGIAPVTEATGASAQAASGLTNLDAWQNPYQRQVIDAALAEYDDAAGRQQAQLQAQGARTAAFGGSRFGIAEGQLAGDVARGRSSLAANLLSQGFDSAAGLSQQDAALAQQAALFNAGSAANASLANAGAANERALALAGLDMQGNLFNAAARNDAAQFGAGAANAASLYNAGQANQFALDRAARADEAARFGAQSQNAFDLAQSQLAAEAGQFGAQARNNAALANQQAHNQFALSQAGYDAQSASDRAAAQNAAALANAASRNQYGLARFGADSDSAAQLAAARNQMALAGYQGNLQTSLAQAQLAAEAGQFNAGQTNAMSQFNAGQANQIGMFNAAQANTLGQFNAGQQDQAANRGLQGAALLGDLAGQYSNNTRADLQLMSQLGEQQRGIEQQYAMAGPAQLQTIGQLSGMTPYQILVGQQVNGQSSGTARGTGTTTATESGSLFDSLLGAGMVAARAGLFSDRALKRDVAPVGTLANGLGLYAYRYLWDGDDRRRRIGVMADEVAAVAPEALGPPIGGFATVDYGRLGLAGLAEG